ncbi:hypothetical protein [Candidatus Nitrosacidococcus sp. I8]|uniref:hypothetical protein n=1 Tax=Candidatus Nitrosacidococcus sp. I8 TaxID=2942908 RepID=UPI0022272810|nr:hypothetical protein [Candidatus Nitrosacidococcus sp. I8]CAH9017405.1 Thiopurine S-methyltransferase [Candidatus Nitrosacidococcus sp. I8]
MLAPLYGKFLDLVRLVLQRYFVIGVETSRLAVEKFFTEHKFSPKIEKTQNS